MKSNYVGDKSEDDEYKESDEYYDTSSSEEDTSSEDDTSFKDKDMTHLCHCGATIYEDGSIWDPYNGHCEYNNGDQHEYNKIYTYIGIICYLLYLDMQHCFGIGRYWRKWEKRKE